MKILLLSFLLSLITQVFSSELSPDAASESSSTTGIASFSAAFQRGIASRDIGDFRSASESFHAAFRSTPADSLAPSALYLAAQCAEKDSALERATELYGVFMRRCGDDPRWTDAVCSMMRLLAHQQDHRPMSDALAAMEKRCKGNPVNRARYLYHRSVYQRKTSRSVEARHSLDTLLGMTGIRFPESEQACLDYLDIIDAVNEYPSSLAVFLQLSEIYRQKSTMMPWHVLFHWANDARMAKSFSFAEEKYATLLRAYPDSANTALVQFRLAECQAGQGAVARAIETLQQLCTLDSSGETGAQSALKLGDIYLNQGMYTSAVASYRHYLHMPGARNHDAVLLRIGRILKDKTGEAGHACAAFDELCAGYPSSTLGAQALFHSAQCCEVMGDFFDALRRYRRVLWITNDSALCGQARVRIGYLEHTVTPGMLSSDCGAAGRGDCADTAQARALAGKIKSAVTSRSPDSAIAAVTVFNTSHPRSPLRPGVMMHLGMAYEHKGDTSAALATYRDLVHTYPQFAITRDARLRVAELLGAKNAFLESADWYRAYLESCGLNGRVRYAQFGRARSLMRAGCVREAQGVLLLLADTARDSLGMLARLALGAVALSDGDSIGALGYFAGACTTATSVHTPAPFLHRGNLLLAMGSYKDAQAAFLRALPFCRTVDDSADALKGSAISLIMDGPQRDIAVIVSRLKARFPDRSAMHAEVLYRQGIRLAGEKSFKPAADRFAECIKQHAGTIWCENAAYQLARLPREPVDTALTMERLAGFIRQFPVGASAASAQSELAALHQRKGEYLRAANLYATAAGNPAAGVKFRFQAAYNSALSYQRMSSWGDAAVMYQQIGRDFPNEVSPSSLHLKIGFCLAQASRYDAALEWFGKASADPASGDKPELLYWIGTCHAKGGDIQKAITAYRDVSYYHPGAGRWASTAQFETARLYEITGEIKSALHLYQEIVATEGQGSELGKSAAQKVDSLLR